jgi:hypothetical protein
MKTATSYQLCGGNPKTAAGVMAEAANITAEPIRKPIAGRADILFIGGGAYK